MDGEFVITRECADLDDSGVRRPGRVYVTGPHFGDDIYSSTTDQDGASRFPLVVAQRLVDTKWRGLRPKVEETA